MRVDVSVGEALDKLSILEIKLREINDPEKKSHVLKEIDTLADVQELKLKYKYYYDLLLDTNTQIWTHTNSIKALATHKDPMFSELANTIFELNQSRFRLKQIINKLCDSSIQEQKSYALTWIDVELDDSEQVDVKRFADLSLKYDNVRIWCSAKKREEFEAQVPKFNYVFLRYHDAYRI